MKIFKIFVLVLSLGTLCYGIYQSLFQTQFTLIKEIRVVGAQSETQQRLRKYLDNLELTSFWHVDVKHLAEQIKSDEWVEDAEIKKIFPDKIVVKVLERQPAAIINRGNNHFAYVDSNNHMFGPAKPKTISEHVILSGKSLNQDQVVREQALQIIKNLPGDGVLNSTDVSEIQFIPEKGFEMILSKTGMKIELGKENISLHMDRARRVVQYLDQHQINATHVDADYAKKVLVKVRKDR